MGVERVRDVQIVFVTTKPSEGLAIGDSLQVSSVDVVTSEDLILLRTKVATNDADDSNVGKEARGDRKVRS